ncbi:hypothetical protein UP09_33620 [Bradyrhizobium sp. LTSP885]|nr:hypothetical protein UP09_33620 [Bradyrhizobium sp. LTSP885]
MDRATQYAAASRFKHRRLWNTGSPAFAFAGNDTTSRQFPPAPHPHLFVGFQPRHREQMVEHPEFVALGQSGELGHGCCDQDQGVIRAALPTCIIVSRSTPAGRFALPAAFCPAQEGYFPCTCIKRDTLFPAATLGRIFQLWG